MGSADADLCSGEWQKIFFILDEWDCVFHLSWVSAAERENYLLFLRSLLKGRAYVELAYMTGILPIVKYSDGSELNMFAEYQMTTMERFSEYFGFTEQEVDRLYEVYTHKKEEMDQGRPQHNVTRADLREWYDGYHTFGQSLQQDAVRNLSFIPMILKKRGSYWNSKWIRSRRRLYGRSGRETTLSGLREKWESGLGAGDGSLLWGSDMTGRARNTDVWWRNW